MYLRDFRNHTQLVLGPTPFSVRRTGTRLSETIHFGLNFLPSPNKAVLSRREPFRTGLYLNEFAHDRLDPVFGRGWHIDFRYFVWDEDHPGYELDVSRSSSQTLANSPIPKELTISAPEALLFARDVGQAHLLGELLAAATLLITSFTIFDVDDPKLQFDRYYSGRYHDASPAEVKRCLKRQHQQIATTGFLSAIELMRQACADRSLAHALLRYCHACRLFYRNPMEFDPSRGAISDPVSRNPVLYTAMALAITSAWTAIEELGLDAKETLTENRRLSPKAVAKTRSLLEQRGISPDETVAWMTRRGMSLVERRAPHVSGKPPSWQSPGVRDRIIALPDAILLCKWLRNQAGAHGTKDITTRLRAQDAMNVSGTVRDVLLLAGKVELLGQAVPSPKFKITRAA